MLGEMFFFQVVLLVDNRENHGGRKGRSICDHLQKKVDRIILQAFLKLSINFLIDFFLELLYLHRQK